MKSSLPDADRMSGKMVSTRMNGMIWISGALAFLGMMRWHAFRASKKSASRTSLTHWKAEVKFLLCQSQQLGFQLILGDIGTDDLVFDFTVLEKQQERNGTNAIFHGEITRLIHIDFADFGLSFDVIGELIDDRTDSFARSAPFGPEIDQNGNGRLKNFGLEIAVSECVCHARNMAEER